MNHLKFKTCLDSKAERQKWQRKSHRMIVVDDIIIFPFKFVLKEEGIKRLKRPILHFRYY